ncbi:amidohydrolase family protein [Azospirillum sp. ST 5-10]|uniref:amidohydrolase family protein n=1 Tax=unclassified Azospirillum TaxID=2630922 RepID=UPI003F4A7E8C
METLVVGSYFDGERQHDGGPYALRFADGALRAVEPVAPDTPRDAAFAMPTLVEAHAHLFLDGGLLDTAARAAAMKADRDAMVETARRSLAQARASGVGLVRDVGDRWGVNHQVRDEANGRPGIRVRSAGVALRRPGRYGGFMGREVADDDAIRAAVDELAERSDDVKVLLTGIIDFAKGTVPGAPQFDADALRLIVERARAHGRPTLAHCSGAAGLEVAVAAGIGSIEHGFFMSHAVLERMAGEGIAWVPTFSPVAFQAAHPQHAGWPSEVVATIRAIVESHREHVALAHQMGVAVICGSDAGSHGVPHGRALVDEMMALREAGVPMEAVLRAATSLPRRTWGAPANDVVPGARPDLLLLPDSPFRDACVLYRPLPPV